MVKCQKLLLSFVEVFAQVKVVCAAADGAADRVAVGAADLVAVWGR